MKTESVESFVESLRMSGEAKASLLRQHKAGDPGARFLLSNMMRRKREGRDIHSGRDVRGAEAIA